MFHYCVSNGQCTCNGGCDLSSLWRHCCKRTVHEKIRSNELIGGRVGMSVQELLFYYSIRLWNIMLLSSVSNCWSVDAASHPRTAECSESETSYHDKIHDRVDPGITRFQRVSNDFYVTFKHSSLNKLCLGFETSNVLTDWRFIVCSPC
jgi:hypothetical protein